MEDRTAPVREDVARNHGFDLLRGLCALIVAAFHLSVPADLRWLPGGYLAVDFFFALSGFVLAAAHGRQLGKSGAGWRFMRQRVVRLYPLYLLGTAIGLFVIGGWALYRGQPGLGVIVTIVGTAPLMLPDPTDVAPYPANFVAWSLALELLVNGLLAAGLLRCPTRVLAAGVVLAGAVLAIAGWWHGNLDQGARWDTLGGGMLRALFSFPAGVLIQRLAPARPLRTSWVGIAGAAVLVAALVLPVPAGWTAMRDLFVALLVSPLVLWVGAHHDVPPAWRRACGELGLLSYPLYAVHVPLSFGVVVLHAWWKLPAAASVLIVGAGVVAFAWAAGRWYDPAARGWLARRLL